MRRRCHDHAAGYGISLGLILAAQPDVSFYPFLKRQLVDGDNQHGLIAHLYFDREQIAIDHDLNIRNTLPG
jgi:hypothetical protein